MCAYLDLDPRFLAAMPPKKRQVEVRGEAEVEREPMESEFSASSPVSVASTASAMSAVPVTAEHLERVIEANQRSMAALIAALPTALASVPVASPASDVSVPKFARDDVPKWTDGENPSEYFSKYEQALTHNGVPKEKWGPLLQIYLSGSAQASFAQVNPLVVKDYEGVKQAMLESLGDTLDGADKRWCTLSRHRGESHRALYRRVHNTGFRRMHGLETKEECCQRMILSKFLTLLSPECYGSVVAKRPKNGQEAARYAQEFEEDTSFARSLQPRPSGGHHNSQNYFSKRETGSNGLGSALRVMVVVLLEGRVAVRVVEGIQRLALMVEVVGVSVPTGSRIAVALSLVDKRGRVKGKGSLLPAMGVVKWVILGLTAQIKLGGLNPLRVIVLWR